MHDGEIHVLARVLDETSRTLRIALSNGVTFDVAPDAPEASQIDVGLVVDADALHHLQHAADRKRAARDVFQLLNRRRYSRGRLAAKLAERDYHALVIEPVLDSFEAQGLVDDLEFARAYCRDQLRKRPVGRGWLQKKLWEQGVDRSLADRVLSELLSLEIERGLAHQALAKRRLRLQDAHDRAKAIRFLQGRGFPSGLCRATVNEASDDASRSEA